MMLARMIAPIRTLGPGTRVGIWTQGCSKGCKGCISREFQSFDRSKEIPAEVLVPIIIDEAKRNACRGLTISGGDPFEQSEELLQLLKGVRFFFEDILVYTGFTLEQINERNDLKECLEFIDVLIDGKYIDEVNNNTSRLYGSDNQNILFFNDDLVESYKCYDKGKRNLETFIHDGKVIVVGIQEGGNENDQY